MPDLGGKWNTKDSKLYWYVWLTKFSGDEINVFWLNKPNDSIMCRVDYPWENELFFSDNCNYGESPVMADEICGKIDVVFLPKPG